MPELPTVTGAKQLFEDLKAHAGWDNALRTLGSPHQTFNAMLGAWWNQGSGNRLVIDEAPECQGLRKSSRLKADLLLVDEAGRCVGVVDAEGTDLEDKLALLGDYLADRKSWLSTIQFGVFLAYKPGVKMPVAAARLLDQAQTITRDTGKFVVIVLVDGAKRSPTELELLWRPGDGKWPANYGRIRTGLVFDGRVVSELETVACSSRWPGPEE